MSGTQEFILLLLIIVAIWEVSVKFVERNKPSHIKCDCEREHDEA
jgi:hypothetical protein